MTTREITFTEEASSAMESRGIRKEDVEEVLEWAEKSGIFLREKEGRALLAKKRIGNFTVYVEYTNQGNCVVTDTYCHRVFMSEDANT